MADIFFNCREKLRQPQPPGALLPLRKSEQVQLQGLTPGQQVGIQGFFQQFWEKPSGQNWEKMINLTAKLGEINGIELNKGSKIYPQNQVILILFNANHST